MTLVNTDTGELAAMGEADARDLIDSLKQAVEIAERQIIRAWQGRAWLALGYESWDEMIAAEFTSHYIKIAPDERRAAAIEMAKHGMSTRAIAPALGVSHQTVANDLAAGVKDLTPGEADEEDADAEPELREVTGRDGKTYTVTPKAADPVADAIAEFPFLADYPAGDVLSTADALRAIPEGPQRDRRIEAAKTWPAAVAASAEIAAAGDNPLDDLDATITRICDSATDLIDLPIADLVAEATREYVDSWRADIDRALELVGDLATALNRNRNLRSVK